MTTKVSPTAKGVAIRQTTKNDSPSVILDYRAALSAMYRYTRYTKGEIKVIFALDGDMALVDYGKARDGGRVARVLALYSVEAARAVYRELHAHGVREAAQFIARLGKRRKPSSNRPLLIALDEQGQPVENWGGWRYHRSLTAFFTLVKGDDIFVTGQPDALKEAWAQYLEGAKAGNYRVAIASRMAWREARRAGGKVTRVFRIANPDTGEVLNKNFPSTEAALKAAGLKGWAKAILAEYARGENGWQPTGNEAEIVVGVA